MSRDRTYKAKTTVDKVCNLTGKRDIGIKYKKNDKYEMFLIVRCAFGRFFIPIAAVIKSGENYAGVGFFWGTSEHELRWTFAHLEVETQANCKKQREDYLHNMRQNLIAAQSSVKEMQKSVTLGKVA